jgi:hypothetical protein
MRYRTSGNNCSSEVVSQVSLYGCVYTRMGVYIRVYSLDALMGNSTTGPLYLSSLSLSRALARSLLLARSFALTLSRSLALPYPCPLPLSPSRSASLALARSLALSRSLTLSLPSLLKRQSITLLASTVGLF